jgi:NAD(P)-dependent dehydrogenase (short-subunit alcohol dehydrogenase family)
MAGKVCLVTGATGGIGLITARELAKLGAKVVLLARNAEKGAAALTQIKAASGADAAFVQVDLSSQAEIRRAAGLIREGYPKIDVLVNNVGEFFQRRELSPDQIELTLALNHLAPFLLTNLLLDNLKAAGQARIVTVSSMAHRGARIPFDDLQSQRHYTGWAVYGQSKLANILFTRELARRLAGTGLTANTLHPGYVATNFALNNGGFMASMARIGQIFAISPEEGAKTSIYLASSPDVAGVSGEYFVKCKPVRSSAASYDTEAGKRLWEISAQMTGLAA